MKMITLLSLMIAVLFISACQIPAAQNETDGLTGRIILDDDDFVFIDDDDEQTDDEETNLTGEEESPSNDLKLDDKVVVEDKDVAYTMTAVEGDLVRLDLQADDPDGDEIFFTYGEPFNENGRWQTRIGDEGRYLVPVTVSDGRLSTTEDVLVIIQRANRPPVIECPNTIRVKEGETVSLNCNIYDEEGDNILISYEGWMTSSTKATTYEDEGEYTVLVRASDGKDQSTKTVTVIVEDVNRPPVLEPINDITVMETNVVRVVPRVNDPDGDEVTVTFSAPLNQAGEWMTEIGDAGVYDVTIVASDGVDSVTDSFTITVTRMNTAPVLRPIEDITVDEGDQIVLPVDAYDPEGDNIIITFSGFMDDITYQTDFGDAGVYSQTVTVSDGVLETSQSFTITINKVNRPPAFVW